MHAKIDGAQLPGRVAGAHPASLWTEQEWIDVLTAAAASGTQLLPLPLLARPTPPSSTSRRVCERYRRRLVLYRIAMNIALGCAWLYDARRRPFLPGPPLELSEMASHHRECWNQFLKEGRLLRDARRALKPTGAAALDEVLKSHVEGYFFWKVRPPLMSRW